MAVSLHVLAQQALALDADERLQLAAELIDSVEGPQDPAWRAAWKAELRRRSDAADNREVRGEEWSEVRARVLRELSRK